MRVRLGPESVLELTDEAYRVLGVAPGTRLRNLDFYRMLHPDDRERMLDAIIAVRTQRARREVDVRLVDADGAERPLVVTAVPANDMSEPGVVTGTIAEATDRHRRRREDVVEERLAAEGELRRAIESEQLFLEYQPILSLATNEFSGAEALVRWQHPTRGRLLPSQFADLAEESGLIHLLGSWVLSRACRDLKTWLDAGVPDDFMMAVNLSAVQLRTEGLAATVEDVIDESGVPASNVLLEVTESVLVEGTLDERSLRSVRDLDVHVAIDDFCTKYSTLGYLSRLPIDALKADGVFVRAIDTEPGRAVVAAIVAIGHALGLRVTAEGIETEQQLCAVREVGGDFAQGFLISRPLSAERCLDTIRRR